MEHGSYNRIKPILRFLSALLIGILSLWLARHSTAQGSVNNPRFGLVNANRNAEAARGSGAGWEIITLRWDTLQPNGPSDWNPDIELDDWLTSTRAAGREVVAVVIGTPAWATA